MQPRSSLGEVSAPHVMVVTPSVGSSHLRTAMRSVQVQTFRNLHHLIVIDGAEFTEAVRGIAREFEGGDRRFDVVELPFNTGGGKYRGHRIYAAFPFLVDADIILYLDEDNWYDADHVDHGVETLRRSSCDWTYALRRIVRPDGSQVCDDDSDSLGLWPRCQTLDLGSREAGAGNPFLAKYRYLVDTSCYVIRRHLGRSVADLWHYGHGADSIVADWLIRSAPVAPVGRVTVNYRLGSRSSSPESFFREGNQVMRRLYGGTFPWRGAHSPVLGAQEHPVPREGRGGS